jgi:hypothetical protein
MSQYVQMEVLEAKAFEEKKREFGKRESSERFSCNDPMSTTSIGYS